jgi:hypothetical protein
VLLVEDDPINTFSKTRALIGSSSTSSTVAIVNPILNLNPS